jgi:hypothetical protein
MQTFALNISFKKLFLDFQGGIIHYICPELKIKTLEQLNLKQY